MSRILVCQHVPYEILGSLDPLFRSNGMRIRYVNFGREPHARPRLEGYRGLVVLGGPMSAHQDEEHPHLPAERELIRRAVEAEIPVLGICLGAQLIAAALGARVYPARRKEIGWYDLSLTDAGRCEPMFAHFADTERIFQWHGDTFDLPPGAVWLARSPDCAHQAFRVGDCVYGLQFHLEVDQAMIERWLTVPAHAAEIEELDGKVDPEQIRRETPVQIDRVRDLADRAFDHFVGLIGRKRRRGPNPHH